MSDHDDTYIPTPDTLLGETTLRVSPATLAAVAELGRVTTKGARPGPAHFEVKGELGRGGMGVVLDAVDPTMDREVAIKVMYRASEASGASIAQFLEEARIQGRLEHPGICPVHEFGVDERGRPWFAMKKVRGRSLLEILKETKKARFEGRTPEYGLARMLDVFARVLDAVEFAHSQGIIHRDLKPANVMVGEFGEVHVMDWGLSRVVNEDNLESSGILGTPAYMAPEQALGRLDQVDEQTDVYSLGALLYHLLTEKAPHSVEGDAGGLRRIQEGQIEPPRKRAPAAGIPGELEAIVMKAMAASKRDRYPSVHALSEELTSWREGRIVSAAHYSTAHLVWKFVLRHRIVTTAILASILVVSGMALAVRVRDERRATEAENEELRLHETRRTTLKKEVSVTRAEVAGLDSNPTQRLSLPNGEPDPEPLERWADAHARHLEALENLSQHVQSGPVGAARDFEEIQSMRAERARVATTVALRYAEFGNGELARLWARRAPIEGEELREKIDRLLRKKSDEALAVVETYLQRARRPEQMGAGFLDYAVTEILRRKSPVVVKRLMQPDALTSQNPWVRLLSIEALGRLGDSRTVGIGGADAVLALIDLLAKTPLEERLDEAVAIVLALTYLGDARGFEPVFERRMAAGSTSAFYRRTEGILSRIPLPDQLKRPKTSEDYLGRGLMRGDQSDLAGAIEDYSTALKINPSNVAALVNRGIAQVELGQHDAAIADQTAALALDAKNLGALINRGNAYLLKGQVAKARADYDGVIAADPGAKAALVGRSRTFEDEGDLARAMADLDRALQLDPEDADAHNNRGILRYRMGRYEDALADYAEAIRLRPERPLPHNNRGLALMKLGRVDQATAAYGEALRRDPTSVFAYNNRGLAYQASGLHDRAEEDFGQALSFAPNVPQLYYNRSRTRATLLRFPLALSDLDEAIKLSPKDPLYHQDRALVLLRLRRSQDAEEAAEAAVELAPGEPGPLLARARCRMGVTRGEEALEDARRARALDPERGLALALEGEALAMVGKRVESIELLRLGTRRFPDEAELYASLARVLLAGNARGPEIMGEVFESLAEAVDRGWSALDDPAFLSLASDTRFSELQKSVAGRFSGGTRPR